MFLLVFGIIWGLMLLRYTFQYPRRQSSAELRGQILDLSKRYVKALAEENKNLMNGGSGASVAGYGKRGKKHHNCSDNFLSGIHEVVLLEAIYVDCSLRENISLLIILVLVPGKFKCHLCPKFERRVVQCAL